MPEFKLNPMYNNWVHLDIANAKSNKLVSLDLSSQAGEYFLEIGDYYNQTGDPEVAFDHADEDMTPGIGDGFDGFHTPLELWEAISEAPLTVLTDEIWRNLSYASTHNGDKISYEDAMSIIRGYPNPSDAKRRFDRLLQGISENAPIPAAVVMKANGDYRILSGNRRLLASKVHKCRPKVQIIEVP